MKEPYTLQVFAEDGEEPGQKDSCMSSAYSTFLHERPYWIINYLLVENKY